MPGYRKYISQDQEVLKGHHAIADSDAEEKMQRIADWQVISGAMGINPSPTKADSRTPPPIPPFASSAVKIAFPTSQLPQHPQHTPLSTAGCHPNSHSSLALVVESTGMKSYVSNKVSTRKYREENIKRKEYIEEARGPYAWAFLEEPTSESDRRDDACVWRLPGCLNVNRQRNSHSDRGSSYGRSQHGS